MTFTWQVENDSFLGFREDDQSGQLSPKVNSHKKLYQESTAPRGQGRNVVSWQRQWAPQGL